MLILLPSETAGERRAELLQNGPVIRTCLSLLTSELFGASAVTAVGPASTPHPPRPPLAFSIPGSLRNLFVVCCNSAQGCGNLEVQKNLWCHQMWCNVVSKSARIIKAEPQDRATGREPCFCRVLWLSQPASVASPAECKQVASVFKLQESWRRLDAECHFSLSVIWVSHSVDHSGLSCVSLVSR